MSTTMSTDYQWIESTSWELPFFGLPTRIPWPTDVDPALANTDPFEIEHLIRAIEAMGPEAEAPWPAFLTASEQLDDLAEAMEDSELVRAAELLAEFERLHPGTAFSLFHQGSIARVEGREEDALRYYVAATEKAPKIGAIWNNLGVLRSMRGQRDEAIEAFKKALEINNQDRTALEGLAGLRAAVKLMRDQNDPNSAVYVDLPSFAKIAANQLNQIANDPDQLLAYGEQLLRDGMIPQLGLQAIERAYALRHEHRHTAIAMAAAFRIAGKFDEARATLTKFTDANPGDAEGFFHLAQICNAAGDKEGEARALERLLEIDPNVQAALGIRFGLNQTEHDPKKEQALAKFGAERKSWMAYILASNIARQRGDAHHAVKWAESAYEIAPETEDVLLHYTAALGDGKNFEKLVSIIKPQIASGKFSRRLNWNYAQVLQQLGLTSDAIAALREALAGEVPPDFKAAAETMIDAWSGQLSGCGVPVEIHKSGFLQRPVLLALADGDGGIILNAGSPLPVSNSFPWRANAPEVLVPVQQGQTGGGLEPRILGSFIVRGVQPAAGAPTTINCHLTAQPDGALHFRATQNGRKLQVGWAPIGLQT